MSFVFANQGDLFALGTTVNKTSPGDLKLRLFTNNVTPGKTDTTSSYTECAATGYAAATLTGASWTVSTINSVNTASYAAVTFTLTAAANCYGYFITNNDGTKLIGSELFPSVFAIPSAGGAISVTLALTAS